MIIGQSPVHGKLAAHYVSQSPVDVWTLPGRVTGLHSETPW